MKVFHSLLFLVISVFLIKTTARYNLLTQKHYQIMLLLTVAVTFLFLGPFIFIVYLSYRDVGSSQNAMNWNNESQDFSKSSDYHWNAIARFGDWFIMMLMRSDLGVWGFLISLVIHLQIYCVLFGLSWCAYSVG